MAEHFITNSLFEEDYWLDGVAPGAWDEVVIERDGRVIGRLPYVVKRRYGVSAISTPWYTPWLGPWIRPSGAKGMNELGHQHQVLAGLIEKLPKCQRVFVPCAPEVGNLMGFHWAGFDLRLLYTYRFNDLSDIDAIWKGMKDKTRNICRKAEKQTVVNAERPLSDVMTILDKTYRRQGLDLSQSYETLERIESAMRPRNQRTLCVAEDAQGRIHGFAYIVFDSRHSFYVAGGGDPELRDSGAQALCVWSAIKEAARHSKVFDFEGSMNPTIESFVRSFGGQLTPRYLAKRTSPGLQAGEILLQTAGALRKIASAVTPTRLSALMSPQR
jgi:hypothetical protein